jgi:SpoVK/Ycf46/Vps4 family AAA+-type ATPase
MAVDWDYIELHASHFVSDGLQNVQKKADEIFRQLMEIDRAVVLFDEVDELVREREKEHDAFGRFLTTSMLPKLAELWSQRKIIYFVATNHIDYFDAAITRSRRFDALILVAPPSYESKAHQIKKLLGGFTLDPLKDEIWRAVREVGDTAEQEMEKARKEALKKPLAKFALLRFDQLDELGAHVRAVCGGSTNIDRTMLTKALGMVADHRLRERAPYIDFVRDRKYGHRDFGLELVWKAEGFDQEYPPEVVKPSGRYWLTILGSNNPPVEIGGLRHENTTHDTVYYGRAKAPISKVKRKSGVKTAGPKG